MGRFCWVGDGGRVWVAAWEVSLDEGCAGIFYRDHYRDSAQLKRVCVMRENLHTTTKHDLKYDDEL